MKDYHARLPRRNEYLNKAAIIVTRRSAPARILVGRRLRPVEVVRVSRAILAGRSA
jgi:hypothetical protein